MIIPPCLGLSLRDAPLRRVRALNAVTRGAPVEVGRALLLTSYRVFVFRDGVHQVIGRANEKSWTKAIEREVDKSTLVSRSASSTSRATE